MSMSRVKLWWIALATALGLAVLLSGCSSRPPAPLRASPSPAPRLLLASGTPTAHADASLTAPTGRSPTPAPATPTRVAPTASPTVTATATPTRVVRFVPTPTPAEALGPSPSPTPAGRAVPVAPTRPAPTPDRDWDPRLTQRGAQLIPAQPRPGQGYWRLVRARWFDADEPPFAGKHYIYLDTLDQAGARQIGVRIQMTSLDQKEDYGFVTTEAKPGEPYAANFAMYIVAPAYRVAPADGAPADAVTGLGLGSIAVPELPVLTSYGFTWQWTVAK